MNCMNNFVHNSHGKFPQSQEFNKSAAASSYRWSMPSNSEAKFIPKLFQVIHVRIHENEKHNKAGNHDHDSFQLKPLDFVNMYA